MTDLPEAYKLETNNTITKDLTVYIGLVFDAILDGEFLEQKYHRFVNKWPVIGGKLVRKDTPYSFTTGNLVDVQTRYLDSSLASVVPVNYLGSFSSDEPSLFDDNGVGDATFHFNNTTLLSFPHESLLSLRITILKDATLLGFCMSHHMCDGAGAYDVVRYFCDFVNGVQIPDMSLPPDVDVKMSTMIKGEDDKDLLRSNEANNMEIMTDQRKMLSIGTLPYMKYVATSIWNNLGPFRIPTQEKFIYLPTKLVQKWQEDCQKEVDQNTEDGNKSIRLTKNDVITAWFFIKSFKTCTKSSSAVHLSYAMDIRPFIQDTKTRYLKNAVLDARIYFSSLEKLHNMSHAQFALHVHRTVQTFQQPSVIRATLQFWEEVNENKLAITPLPENVDKETKGVASSWTGFRYDELNLEKAVKKSDGNSEGEVGDENKRARCVYVQPRVTMPGGALPSPYVLTVKDGDKGFWLRVNNTVEAWKSFD